MPYLIQRIAHAVGVLFLVSVVTFLALRTTPGNVVTSLFNPVTASDEAVARAIADLGLDAPLWEQYWDYISGVLRGDLGFSIVRGSDVTDLVGSAIGYTLLLAAAAFVVAFGLGAPVGMISALSAGRMLDRIIRVLISVFQAVPNFVLALLAVLVFGVQLDWLPVSGADSPLHLVLPTLVLAAEPGALTARVSRTAVLEQLSSDYTRTLRARGVAPWRIHWVHVLRNSLSPVISLGGVQVRSLLGYTLIVEVIFRWPGLGSELVASVLNRDYPVAQSLTLLLAAVVVVSSVMADLLYRWADPRVRLTGSEAQ